MSTRATAARSTYRHGDLKRTLLDAGIELARAGGPDAVVLREATRRAGVVPNAAYRHFSSHEDLLQAVRAAALAALAVAIERELAKVPPGKPTVASARAWLRAVGTAYLRFAQTEPGLFRTAFSVRPDPGRDGVPRGVGKTGLGPFGLLGAALDRLVESGALAPSHRPGAEYLAWSAVHGLAMLLIDGPLRDMPRTRARKLGQRVLDMVEQGL